MTGAESLLQTAESAGIDLCITNPGTSEAEVIRALEASPGWRGVLCLFEGVCTGAADGYARMAERPAITLLHLGVGFGHGSANLHNARKSRTPMFILVGNHDHEHLPYNSPCTSDIETLARPVSDWVRMTASSGHIAGDAAKAIEVAQKAPGQVATLIAPANTQREKAPGPALVLPRPSPPVPDAAAIDRTVEVLREKHAAVLLMSGVALRKRGRIAAHRIAAASGCVPTLTVPTRVDRGAGVPTIAGYPGPRSGSASDGDEMRYLILAGAPRPTSDFSWPGASSDLVPDGCEVITLASQGEDSVAALEIVADHLGAPADAWSAPELAVPEPPTGELTPQTAGQAIASVLPEGAIIADESITAGGPLGAFAVSCPPHTTLNLAGGAVGWGLPTAVGAALACPDRPVFGLSGDGGAMYTVQALWTQAREGLNVTNIIFSNRRYEVLRGTMKRLNLDPTGPVANALTYLGDPDIDFSSLARGMGVPGTRPDTAEALHDALTVALAEPGPHLIDVVVDTAR